ncbi:MAG: hypothetical protein ABI147_05375 [Acidobacteriaceae bacterium]
MRHRTHQFAFLLLLLCAFGGVDAAVRSAAQGCRDCTSLKVLLLQVASVSANRTSADKPFRTAQPLALASASPAAVPAPFAMRPPAAHAAHVNFVTASGI